MRHILAISTVLFASVATFANPAEPIDIREVVIEAPLTINQQAAIVVLENGKQSPVITLGKECVIDVNPVLAYGGKKLEPTTLEVKRIYYGTAMGVNARIVMKFDGSVVQRIVCESGSLDEEITMEDVLTSLGKLASVK